MTDRVGAPRELVCATANPGKVAEIAGMLPAGWVLLPRPEGVGSVVEDAGTLVGNARLKARAILAATTALLIALLIGSLPGIAIGSHLAARVPDRYLRPALATMMAVVGAKLSL